MKLHLLATLMLSFAIGAEAQTAHPPRADLMRQCAAEWKTRSRAAQGASVKYQSYMSDCLKRKAAVRIPDDRRSAYDQQRL